ncbi:MAG TPA: hypothetical protein VNB49_01020 [Candidatus Dormibacteraeota bacterium]|nr:hypothetical protein [Candidatus Dormibacteraeota bacterium]
MAGSYVADRGTCANLSLIGKKIELYGSAQALLDVGLNKQTINAEVANAREAVSTVATPQSVNVFFGCNARVLPAEIR